MAKLVNVDLARNDQLVHNPSLKELTKDHMQILRHEPSFNTADATPVNMIEAVESVFSQTEATKSLIRPQVPSLLMAHRPWEVLSKVERDALRELKADKDLVIVPADKGRSTVVLDRTDYLQITKGLLEDRQFNVTCATNPVKALTCEINAKLLDLENSGAITPTDRRMARPQDTALARFYGLPKVHKDGAPLRPIVSLKGTPTYGLAKWLFRRPKFLTAEPNTTVSSPAEFLEKLKGDLAIETIELLLQSKYDEMENRLGRAQVLQLLKLCLRAYFTFDETVYQQVKGTPMGSPISGFIAEAVLQRLESLVFQHHRPKFWVPYVDDTFVIIDRDQLLTFKEHLSAVFPDIQFTMKEDENNQLAFLDVRVCRKYCDGVKTKVFRKATNTMQVLNFNSNHPISTKGKMCCVISAALKFIVTIVNLVLGLAFIALAIVGILLKTSSGFIQSIVRKIFDSVEDKLSQEEVDTIVNFIGENSTGLSAICIVVGAVLAVLCFIGFFASCCGCTCLLKIYGSYVVLAMKELLKEYNPTTDQGKSAAVLWDLTMQVNGFCCGLDGAADFNATPYAPNAPGVCCGNATIPGGGCTIAYATAMPSPVEGCRAKILDFAIQNMDMVMYIFIAAILLQGVLLALVIGAIYVNKVSPV
nr:unnamed protein product [Spirometra erinaceieuropaei]